jgi:hypothetical protein
VPVPGPGYTPLFSYIRSYPGLHIESGALFLGLGEGDEARLQVLRPTLDGTNARNSSSNRAGTTCTLTGLQPEVWGRHVSDTDQSISPISFVLRISDLVTYEAEGLPQLAARMLSVVQLEDEPSITLPEPMPHTLFSLLPTHRMTAMGLDAGNTHEAMDSLSAGATGSSATRTRSSRTCANHKVFVPGSNA